ncbi:DUF4004 family protein [Paenibacillaceae bacterium]|nr:DUF4004 family protein [Paenibacillaceae bacterium]
MEEDLISKKDLLSLKGISYGQLYRWKRKRLIPEEWFIRKASFTGQETYFPRAQILSRIDRILNMKDDLSLDELADVFSPALGEVQLERGELLGRNIVSEPTMLLFSEIGQEPAFFNFRQVLLLYVVEKLLRDGSITQEEGKQLISVMMEHYDQAANKSYDLMLIRKMGVSLFFLVAGNTEVYMERTANIVFKLPLETFREELKIILG